MLNPISAGLSPMSIGSSVPTGAAALVEQSSRQHIESVGEEMEGVFLSMMLKELRNSLDEGFFGSEGSDTYGGMFDMFIGKHLSATKPLGIAEMLLEQYTKQSGASPGESDSNAAANAPETRSISQTA